LLALFVQSGKINSLLLWKTMRHFLSSSLHSNGTARALVVASCLAAASLIATPTRADEFSTVPAGDALYRELNVVTRSGWTSATTATPNTSTASALNTRYEMALQTAEALLAVRARYATNPVQGGAASPAALRALRALTTTLGPELRKLGVDTNASLRLLQQLEAGDLPANAAATSPIVTERNSTSTPLPSSVPSLARRLRVDSANTASQRAAADPFNSGQAEVPLAFL
jgi:hypothetical protein